MSKTKPWIVLLCISGLLFFVFGLAQLLVARFERGGGFPEYSTLRTDPLGSKAFYEALQSLPHLTVTRNLQPWYRLSPSPSKTVFWLGEESLQLALLPPEVLDKLEAFIHEGNRLVITFSPREQPDADYLYNFYKALEEEDEDEKSLGERWGFSMRHTSLQIVGTEEEETIYEPLTALGAEGYTEWNEMEWYSGLFFIDLETVWTPILSVTTGPVLIERSWGKGSIVMATDSYFLSNEGVWDDPQSELLVWLVGLHSHIVFDEVHLGITERAGVMSLALKYRLHGVIVVLFLLAGLMLWRNAIAFMPAYDDSRMSQFHPQSGRDSMTGFISLLKRAIRSNDLTFECWKAWSHSASLRKGISEEKYQQIESLVQQEQQKSPKERQPLKTYQAIQHILNYRHH